MQQQEHASRTTAGRPAPTLRDAAGLLAAYDSDYAREENGVGFSKFDGEFGHWLAETPEERWSPRARHAAWKMLRKYRRQLAANGLDFDAIPEPPTAEALAAAAPKAKPPAPPATLSLAPGAGFFLIHAPYDAKRVEEARALPGRRWDPAAKADKVPATPEAATALLAFIDKWGIAPAADAAQRLIDLRLEGIRRASEAAQLRIASTAADGELDLPNFGVTPYPFQRAGILYARRTERTFIADQMGLGKTIQALGTLVAAEAYPALVVCPASLKLNWAREALRALHGRTIQILNGKPPADGYYADLIIVNYDVLNRHLDGLKAARLQAVILDESHYIKNPKAQRTTAAMEIGKTARIRLCLTGTPVTNRPAELPSQLQFLGRLGEFGGRWKFLTRYCGAYHNGWGWQTGGATHLEELNDRLRSSCYIRRTKDQVLTELPPKQRASVPLAIDNRAEYTEAERELVRYLADRAANDAAFAASIAHLPEDARRHAIAERRLSAAEKARAAEALVRISTLKLLAARGKLAAAVEWITDFLDEGEEKLVVFAHHKEVIDGLVAAFPGTPTITGATPIDARQAAVDRFQTDPDCRLIALNLQAGGVGLTLTAARSVAFLELGWNPAVHDQAEDRCHRIGQRDSVTAYYLLGLDTIDEEIGGLIEGKRDIVDRTTDGHLDESVRNRSVMADLMARLAARAGATGLDAEAYAEAS